MINVENFEEWKEQVLSSTNNIDDFVPEMHDFISTVFNDLEDVYYKELKLKSVSIETCDENDEGEVCVRCTYQIKDDNAYKALIPQKQLFDEFFEIIKNSKTYNQACWECSDCLNARIDDYVKTDSNAYDPMLWYWD